MRLGRNAYKGAMQEYKGGLPLAYALPSGVLGRPRREDPDMGTRMQ